MIPCFTGSRFRWNDVTFLHRALMRNIGFQLLMRRHYKKDSLHRLIQKIGYSVKKIDAVELGRCNAQLDTLIAISRYYKQDIDFDNLQKAYRLG